jgi:membrane-bound ClpP family serine protease
METVRHTQKRYCSRALTLAIAVGAVLIFADFKPMGKGLILGTLFSILNFILMAQSIAMRMNRSQTKTFFFSIGSIFFRYGLMAIPLVASIRLDSFDLFGVIVGLFSIPIVILSDHIITILLPTRAGQKQV